MRFDKLGLRFDYPDNWTVDISDAQGGQAAITVYSPEGGFWSISAHAPGEPASRLSEAVVAEMREEYRELDMERASDSVSGHSLPGYDLNFYCLDLTNTAAVRTLETADATYLLLCQAEDREWERIARVFSAITESFVRALDRREGGPAPRRSEDGGSSPRA